MNRYRNGSGFLYGRGCFALNCPNANSTNVALPDEFDKILSTMRSREISVSIIIQNMAQLKALFEKQWESIVGNCDELLYLGGNEQSTHEYVSKLLGKETIDYNTYGQSKGRSGSYSTNWQISERSLLDPTEVRLVNNDSALLFIRGERPVEDRKYNVMKHPNVSLTSDGGAEPYINGEDTGSYAAVGFVMNIPEEMLKNLPKVSDNQHHYETYTEENVEELIKSYEEKKNHDEQKEQRNEESN